MGVFFSDQPGDRTEVIHQPTKDCFFCGERLTGERFVFWQGNDERGIQIWLHVGCAGKFSGELVKDWVKARK
jgi:hypothetical protein